MFSSASAVIWTCCWLICACFSFNCAWKWACCCAIFSFAFSIPYSWFARSYSATFNWSLSIWMSFWRLLFIWRSRYISIWIALTCSPSTLPSVRPRDSYSDEAFLIRLFLFGDFDACDIWLTVSSPRAPLFFKGEPGLFYDIRLTYLYNWFYFFYLR